MTTQLVFLVTLVAVVVAQEGRYLHDHSGSYYHNPHEGRYIHDDSGKYYHDGAGNYAHDGTGHYAGQKDPYSHDNDKYRSGANLIGANTVQAPKRVIPPGKAFGDEFAAATKINYGKIATGVTGTGQYNDQGRWKIIRQSGDVDLDGYHWEYLTENKINAEERGKVLNVGTDEEALRAKGFFTYTGPDNIEYHIQYTADENGFIPVGEHIPTPPPVPEAIKKALEYQRKIGTL